jgi:hypothetical protein
MKGPNPPALRYSSAHFKKHKFRKTGTILNCSLGSFVVSRYELNIQIIKVSFQVISLISTV